MKTAVVMLAKSPAVDPCKTRMTDVLSQAQANDLQETVIHHIMNRILPCPDYDFWVAAPRRESLSFFAPYTSLLTLQTGHDLGDTMWHLLAERFEEGYDRVILIGSDMPLVSSALLREAMHLLQQHDCVIGPATDGGYYLIGTRLPIERIFYGVHWSTNRVFGETVKRLEAAGRSYAQLPEHRDLDTWSDVLYYESLLATLGIVDYLRSHMSSNQLQETIGGAIH